MKDLVLDGVDQRLCEVRISDLSFCLHINRLLALTKGGARKSLLKICENADILGVALSLNACPVRTDLYPESMSTEWLTEWYERFGFEKFISDHHYYYFMSNVMLRRPHA